MCCVVNEVFVCGGCAWWRLYVVCVWFVVCVASEVITCDCVCVCCCSCVV